MVTIVNYQCPYCARIIDRQDECDNGRVCSCAPLRMRWQIEKVNMLKKKFAKMAVAATFVVAGALGLAGCSGSNSTADPSAQTAVTINGATLSEGEITSQIQSIRDGYGLLEDSAWGQWLAQYGMTPETIRQQMIDAYVEQELVKSGAAELGISVEDSEVDSYIEQMRANYDSDEAWESALASSGFSEDDYRDTITSSILKTNVQRKLAESVEVTDDEKLEYAKQYASILSGSKRSSHILFASDDTEKAQKVLDQLKSGVLSFEEAAKQDSTDRGSAANGGDVGWDKVSSFVSEYTTALGSLEKGQISDLVTSKFGIHIIKCTDIWEAPSEITSIDQIPSDMLDAIVRMSLSKKSQSAFSDWIAQQKEKATIEVADMPKGLSYDIDMSKYPSNSTSPAPGASSDSEKPASNS